MGCLEVCLGVYIWCTVYTCMTGVHRCKYENEGVYRVYKGCKGVYNIMLNKQIV